MGNLTNPVSLRLRLNVYWNSLWVSYIDNNYSFLLSSDFLLYSYIRWFTYRKIFLTVGWLFYYSHFKIFRLFDKIFIIFFFKDYKFYKFFFEYVCIILKLNNSLHKKSSRGIFRNIKLLNNFNVSKVVSSTKKIENKRKNYLNFCWLFIFFDLQKVFYTLSFNNKTKTMDKIYIFFQNIFFLTNFIYLFFIFLFVVFFLCQNFNLLQYNLKKKFFNNIYLYFFYAIYFLNTARIYNKHMCVYSVANPVLFFTSLNLNYLYFTNKNLLCNIKKPYFVKKSYILRNLLKFKSSLPKINTSFFNQGLLPFKKVTIKRLTFVNFVGFDMSVIYRLNILKKNSSKKIKVLKNWLNTNFFVTIGVLYFKILYTNVFTDRSRIKFNSLITTIFKKIWILRRNRKRMRVYRYIVWLRRIVKRTIKLLSRKMKYNTSRFYLSFFSFSPMWLLYIRKQFCFFKEKALFGSFDIKNERHFFNNQINQLYLFTHNNMRKFSCKFPNKFLIWKLYYYYYFKYLIFFKSFCKYKNYFSKFFKNLIFVKTRKIIVKKTRYLKKFKKLNKNKLKKFTRFFNKKNFFNSNFSNNKKIHFLTKKVVAAKTFFYNFNSVKIKRKKNIIKMFFSFPNLLVHRRLVFSYFNKRFKKYLLTWRLSRFNGYGYIYNNVYSSLSFNNILLKYTWNRTVRLTNIKFKHALKKDLSFFFNQYIKLNSITVRNPCVLNNNIFKFYLNILNNFFIVLLLRKLKNIGLYIKYHLHFLLLESKQIFNKIAGDIFNLKNFSSFYYHLNLFLKYLNLLASAYTNSFLMHYFIILKKSVQALLANISNQKKLFLYFKYFYLKLFEFVSFFFSSFKEISKYRLFFIQSISLLTYISKNFNISNLNFRISVKKKNNILFLKKKNKMNFFLKKRFSRFFYCENFLDLNKNLLLFKYKLLSVSKFRFIPQSYGKNCCINKPNLLWFVNFVKNYKYLPKLIFVRKGINISKSLFNNFTYLINFFNKYYFNKFAKNVRFFYKKLFIAFNKNYFYFLKINNFWELIQNENVFNKTVAFILKKNINMILLSIFSRIYNEKYFFFMQTYNKFNKVSLYINFYDNFVKKNNAYVLKTKIFSDFFVYIYKYFLVCITELFMFKKVNNISIYLHNLKNFISMVFITIYSSKFKKIQLCISFFTKFFFKKLFVIAVYKAYFYKNIVYRIIRNWFFKLVFCTFVYTHNINLFSDKYWKIFFYKFFALNNKNLIENKYWRYSLYLYNTFKFSVIKKKKRKKINFWLFNKQINTSIFFYKNKKKKVISLLKKKNLLHYKIFKKNLKIKKVKYIQFLQTLKQTQKSKLYIYILKNLLKTIV